MKIKFISLKNFKGHRSINDMPFHDFTVLIGENDCGKTTIIDFLELMLTNINVKEDYYHKFIDDTGEEKPVQEIEGQIIFDVDDDEANSLKEFLDENNQFNLKRTFSRSGNKIFIRVSKYKDTRFYEYNKPSFKAPELTAFVDHLGLGTFSKQEDRKAAVDEYIAKNKAQIPAVFGWLEKPYSEVKTVLPKFIRYSSDDYKNPSNIIFQVLQEVFEDELYQKNEDGIKELKNANLKEVVENIRKKLVESTERFKEHIQKFNDKVEEITLEPDIDLSNGLKNTPIFVRKTNGIANSIDAEGSGTKKRLFLAITEWQKEVIQNIHYGYAIRCYDEPDNNLHVEAQRQLFRSIKSIYQESKKKNQVLICTHSLFMIDTVPAKSINLIKKDVCGNSMVEYLSSYGDEEVQQFIDNMCREMGLANSHIFFEKCFILIEGETEANLLPSVYKKLYGSTMAEDGITLINLHGNGSAVDFLKLLIKNKKDLIILFLDNDSLSSLEGKLLKSPKKLFPEVDDQKYNDFLQNFWREKVILIGDKELEDAFTNDIIASALNKHVSTDHWSAKDIYNIRNSDGKFSSKITALVAQYCEQSGTHQYLKKPDLGKILANMVTYEEIKREEIPEILIELFEKARNIAGINSIEVCDDSIQDSLHVLND